MKDVRIVTYTQVPELYSISSELIDLPYPKLALRNWSHRYVADLMNMEADWIIHIDEDAFVIDSSRIQSLLDYMEANNFACCGMPDGGVSYRTHNPVACNPFFNIINRRLVKDALARDPRVFECE
jgi:hypothetical protein